MICYSNYNELWANNVLYACGCQAALLYHIEFGNHYTCKFLFLYAQGPRVSFEWIYKKVQVGKDQEKAQSENDLYLAVL